MLPCTQHDTEDLLYLLISSPDTLHFVIAKNKYFCVHEKGVLEVNTIQIKRRKIVTLNGFQEIIL